MKRSQAGIISLILVLALVSLAGFGLSGCNGSKKVIRVIFDMDPATVEYDDGVPNPVFEFDTRPGIEQGLKKAGFKVVAENKKNYDLTLRVTHRERARQTGSYVGDTSHVIMIDHFGYVLEDKDGEVLLEEASGPFGTHENMAKLKDSLVEELLNAIEGYLETDKTPLPDASAD